MYCFRGYYGQEAGYETSAAAPAAATGYDATGYSGYAAAPGKCRPTYNPKCLIIKLSLLNDSFIIRHFGLMYHS